MSRYGVFHERDVVTDLHFVEEPIGVALQDFSQLHAHVSGRLTEAVHDAAEGCFVDAQHTGQAVLPDSSGVHPQL